MALEHQVGETRTSHPVVITGMHRSGTSMVARLLAASGLHLGADEDLIGPSPDNPDGFFEHKEVVRINEDLLEAAGGSWDLPPSAPWAIGGERFDELVHDAKALAGRLATPRPWGWKDPRACLTAGFWTELHDDARFVICVRHPLEVALSLKRRNQLSYALSLDLWQRYYEALLGEVSGERRIVTHYDRHFADGQASERVRLSEFSGLDGRHPSPNPVKESLRHHHIELTLVEAGVSPRIVALYRSLCDEAGHPGEPATTASAPRLERTRIDLALAQQHLEGRDRQIESLRAERDELKSRLSALEHDVVGLGSRMDAVTDELILADRALSPEARQQIGALRAALRRHVDPDDSVLIVAKGDEALLARCGRPAANFPQDEHGAYPGFALANGTSCIAHLEALRARHHRFLHVPGHSRWWLDEFPDFAQHLAGRYAVAECDDGLLFDLRAAPGEQPGTLTLAAALDVVAGDTASSPSVLDWTALDLTEQLRGARVFAPPPDAELILPYLDSSVDVVLVDRSERRAEAARVAEQAVIVVRFDGPAPVADDVIVLEDRPDDLAGRAEVVLVPTDRPDDDWLAMLQEATSDMGGVRIERSADAPSIGPDALVALIDPGVLPLPGALDAVRRTFSTDARVGAVAVKVLAADGAIEAAGSMLFADGTWAGIAGGSFDTDAPWHHYARDVCAGSGLTVSRADHLGPSTPPLTHTEWCAAAWSCGRRVRYQPEAAVVRSRDLGSGTPEGALGSWARVAWGRPRRPARLDDTAWRALLAEENITEQWS